MTRLSRALLSLVGIVGTFAAQAQVLVYEGFDVTDYALGSSAYVTLGKSLGEHSIGFTKNTSWATMGGSQVKCFAADKGLSLPQVMTDNGFTAIGGSCGLNPDNTGADMRAMNHSMTAGTLNVQSGTLAFRMLINGDETALGKLTAKSGLAGSNSYFGFGVTTAPNGNDWWLLTKYKSSLAFCVWKHSTDGYVLSFSVVDVAGTVHVYDIGAYEAGVTYVCYAEVTIGTGADGADIIRAGAVKSADLTLDLAWADLAEESKTVEVDFISETSYPTTMAVAGPYGTKPGYFRADELCIGTELTDVIPYRSLEPKLTPNDANVAWNSAASQFEVSGKMLNNSATLQASARVSSDDTAPVSSGVSAEIAEGEAGTVSFTGLVENKTYSVSLTATNSSGSDTKPAGTLYNGDLTIEVVRHADEFQCQAGEVRISRAAADPYALRVNYSLSSETEGAESGKTWEADDGYVIIPASETSAVIAVKPMVDSTVNEDIVVKVALTTGAYRNAGTGIASVNLVNAGYNVWQPQAEGDLLASNPNNWSLGRAPNATDNILIDGSVSNSNLVWDAAATSTVRSWVQGNGYSGTVTVETVFPGKGDFQRLNVTGNMTVDSGTLTHPQSWTMGENKADDWDWLGDLLTNETYRLRVDCGSLTVGTGASIDVATKGYYASHDAARLTSTAHGGGMSPSGPQPYGDPKAPIHIGLPLRVAGNYYNGKGGGAIYLTVTGAAVVNGTISADSGNSGHGAGAAGSVYLSAFSLTGTGRISAYGSSTGEGNYKGTGGRVAIVTENPVDRSTFAAITANAEWKSSQGSRATCFGGCGTVYFKDSTMSNGLLIVGGQSDAPIETSAYRDRVTVASADGDWTFDAVEFNYGGRLVLKEGTALHLPNGLSCITSTSTQAHRCGIRYEGGVLDIGTATDQVMSGKWMLTGWSPLDLDCNLTLSNGAAIGVPPMETVLDGSATLPTFVSCGLSVTGNLTFESGTLLMANTCGVKKGANDTEVGLFGYQAHGGRNAYFGTTKLMHYQAYDSVFSPCFPGCSAPNPNGQTASASGGAIRLVVGGNLRFDGTADLNGVPEDQANQNAAAGAGGALDITAGTFTGSGIIAADGGRYQNNVCGPGGRIAVKLTSAGADFSGFSGRITASGRVQSGNAHLCDASAGTVYLATADQGNKAGTVVIAQNVAKGVSYYSSGNVTTTEMVSLGYGGDDVPDYKRVSYLVKDYGRAAVNTNMSVQSVLVADANSFIDLEGHELKLKEFLYVTTVDEVAVTNKLAPGTYAFSDLNHIPCVLDSSEGGTGSVVINSNGLRLIVR